jgi:hypothetical protein
LLLVLAHFFENAQWGLPAETAVDEQSLTAEDQLFVLLEAGLYLAATRGFAAPEALVCYERAELFCRSLGRPIRLSVSAHRAMALFAEHGQTDNNDADCRTDLLAGEGAK